MQNRDREGPVKQAIKKKRKLSLIKYYKSLCKFVWKKRVDHSFGLDRSKAEAKSVIIVIMNICDGEFHQAGKFKSL